MAKSDWDAIVVGAGVTGAVTALLLAQNNWRVCVLDQRQMSLSNQPSDRVVAIGIGAERILGHIGVWSGLDASRLSAYDQMIVDAKGQSLVFRADEHGLPHLGTLVEIPLLENALWEKMETNPNVSVLAPVTWHDVQSTDSGVRMHLVNDKGDVDQSLTAKILVGADGAHSGIRKAASIETTWWDYNQKALIGPVTTQMPNRGIAWQRFTTDGPLALLPLPDGRSSIVWSIPTPKADALANGDPNELVDAINEAIESIGRASPMGRLLSIDSCKWMPLKRQRAKQLVAGQVVLVGDAAHSVHPLAGQGLNLGIGDAAALAECLAKQSSLDSALSRYHRWRLSQSTLAATGIHWINEVQRLPLDIGRFGLGFSFLAANALWPIRQRLLEHASGMDRDAPMIAKANTQPFHRDQ